MFLVDIANPWATLIALFVTVCFIYIGKEGKNAKVPLMPLIVFLILLVMHGIQFLTLPFGYEEMAQSLGKCLAVDFVMILLSYISYLWVDEIEAKAKKKKSIDNSLKWFWKNV